MFLRLLIFLFFLFMPKTVFAVDCSNIPKSGNYTVSSACSFPGTVNGIDAGSGITNNAVLTVGAGGTLSVLSGQTFAVGSIIMSGGSIAIIDTANIKVGTPLYLPDADGDGYPTSVTTTQYTQAGANRTRRYIVADCNESNAAVWQYLTGYADADGDAYTVSESSQVCSGATLPSGYLAYASSPTDVNDAQACADADTPATSTSALYNQTCKKCVNGGLANQTSEPAQDLFNQCNGLDCDGGATKYYFGWSGNTCYYMNDVSPASHVCDGAGACQIAADRCPHTSQGYSTGVTRTACKTMVGCTGTTAGTLGNVANGSDTYNDCAAPGTGNECATGNCNGAGACAGIDPGFEGLCPACKLCGGGTTCVNVTNNTQDTQGTNLCNSTCKKCSSGSCVNQLTSEDLFNQCPAANTSFVLQNSGTGTTCNTQCGYYQCNNGTCNGSGACDSNSACRCTSVGTDAGGTNTYAMAQDCVQYSGKTCSLSLDNLGYPICGGRQSKWTNCKCQL